MTKPMQEKLGKKNRNPKRLRSELPQNNGSPSEGADRKQLSRSPGRGEQLAATKKKKGTWVGGEGKKTEQGGKKHIDTQKIRVTIGSNRKKQNATDDLKTGGSIQKKRGIETGAGEKVACSTKLPRRKRALSTEKRNDPPGNRQNEKGVKKGNEVSSKKRRKEPLLNRWRKKAQAKLTLHKLKIDISGKRKREKKHGENCCVERKKQGPTAPDGGGRKKQGEAKGATAERAKTEKDDGIQTELCPRGKNHEPVRKRQNEGGSEGDNPF